MNAIRDFLDVLGTIATLWLFAFLAGTIVGAFAYGFLTIAGLAP